MKLSELAAKEDAKSWLELRWLQVHGWYDTIAQLEEELETQRIEGNRLYGIGQDLVKENDALKGNVARVEAERASLTFELNRETGEPITEIAERITREGLALTDALLAEDKA